jgi:carboxyl-terminal processing protease
MKYKWFTFIAAVLLFMTVVSLACSSTFNIGRNAASTPDQSNEGIPEVLTAEETRPSLPATAAEVDREELFTPFWEAWEIVQNQYVDRPVDQEALMQGAIRGMLDALGDQHTSYMDPDQFRQANIPLSQEYEGIGAWVDTNAEFLTIVSPMPDSPAEQAGLKPGDKVIGIDGDDMTGIDGNLVIRRVLGPAGSTVNLTIRRDGPAGTEPQIFDVEIVRGRITVPSIDSEMLEGDIGYVRLFQFAENSHAELRSELEILLAENPVGLIVDLRNNGGGYLNTAIEITSEFIPTGVVLVEEFGDGRREVYEAYPGGLATEIPLVILINEGSASASEILAGAVQDYQRGTLVGATTFGKGSVQTWVPLSDDQGAVRVTIARWLTPNERQIHGIGLAPEVPVELTEEDILAERDPQLEKAIELLTR